MTTSNGKAAQKRNDGSAGRAAGAKKAKKRSRGRSRAKKVDPAKYWGDPAVLPEFGEYVTSTPDPSIVVSSLGRPPIPGHENASKHYFSLVYERASALAVALAAAGRLTDYGYVIDDDDDWAGDDDESADPEGSAEHDDGLNEA